MSARGTTIAISVLADAAGVRKGTAEGTRSIKTFATSATGLLTKLGLAYAGFKGFQLLKDSISEAYDSVKEQDKLLAQTNATLKSTGGVAGTSAAQILKMSDALERKSLIDAEAIQSGANVLLTFTNVRNEVGRGNDIFNQATQTITDMSTALGTDMKAQSIQVGKALNDPIKGVSALSRVGVSFTAGQKKTIKSLVDSGQTMKAQKIILAELSKEFGGSAAAAGGTFAGKVKHLKDIWDGWVEAGVRKVVPYLDTLVTFLDKSLPRAIATTQGVVIEMTPAFQGVADAVSPVFNFMRNNAGVTATFGGTILVLVGALKVWTLAQAALNIVMTANPIGLVVVAIAGLAAGLVYAYNKSETFRTVVQAAMTGVTFAFKKLQPVVSTVAGFIGRHWKTVGTVILAIAGGPIAAAAFAIIANFGKIKNGIGATVTFIKGVPGKIRGFFTGIGGDMKAIGTNLVDGLANGISGAWHKVTDFVQAGINKIPKKIRSLMGIKSPSRVTMALGRFISLGLARGLIDGGRDVDKAVTDLTGKTGKKFKAQSRVLFRTLRAEAKASLREAMKIRNDYASSVTAAAKSFGSITSTPMPESGPLTAQTIIDSLKQRLRAIRDYNANLAKLRKMGLSKAAYKQLVDAGVDGGGQYAVALLQGGKKAVKSVSSLTGKIGGASASLGTKTSRNLYQAGVDSAKGYLRGLNSYISRISKRGDAIGAALVRSLKRALGIKSPSRVFMGLGQQTLAGLQVGLDLDRVRSTGRSLATSLVRGYGTPALAASVTGGGNTVINVYLSLEAGLSEAEMGQKFWRAISRAQGSGLVPKW